MNRRTIAWGVALAAVLAVGVVVARSALAPTPLRIDRVVFVTLDTTRSDHFKRTGYPIDTAPFVDGLAARGTTFTRAYSHSATTGPAHASMFTSLYPIQHRVSTNGEILDEEFLTVAEVLTPLGVDTAAFVSGMRYFGQSQIAQGFATYDEPPAWDAGTGEVYRPAVETTDAAIAWFRTLAPDARFFTWVHYYDPHPPYDPPQEHIDAVTPTTPEEEAAYEAYLRTAHHLDGYPKLRQLITRMRLYDAEIHYADAQLRRLYDELETLGLNERTLWVITADHGEGLGNHDWLGHHTQVYNSLIHVPLIVYGDGAPALGDIDDQLVQHVDLAVTFTELFGADMSAQTGPIQGHSLVPLLEGRQWGDLRDYAFSERRRVRKDKRRPRSSKQDEAGERYALQSLQDKYIWYSEGPHEFYAVGEDPYETRDRIGTPSAEKDEMKRIIEHTVETLRTEGDPGIVDEETLRALEALGYTD